VHEVIYDLLLTSIEDCILIENNVAGTNDFPNQQYPHSKDVG
jgi:hypothetical protein